MSKGKEKNLGGRPLIFKSPEDLESVCEEYFDWCDDNPWYRSEAIKSGDRAGEIIKIPTQRPYTLIAMCQHININPDTWYEYEKRDGFSEITTRIHDKIRNQKFEGAAVGAFNANIIARDLGLSDKKELEHSGNISSLSPEERESRINKLKSKLGSA